MRLFSSNKPSDNSSSRKTLSIWTLLSVLVLLSAFLASNTSSTASAAPSGFCAECQTYAYVVQQCGGTFTESTIMIDGEYNPPQELANCVCKAVIQKLLWACSRCIQLAGKMAKTPPPNQYQMTCTNTWKVPYTTWTSGYTGTVAPGTLTVLTKDGDNPNSVGPVPPAGGLNPSTSTGTGNNGGGTGTNSGTLPTSSDGSTSGNGESNGPNGTAIGISLGIIGVAAVAGGVAVVMMKRRRRRHTPLELDGTYVGLEDQWEKPARPQTPPMMPAPVANGGRGGGGGLMRPSPFESRPPGSVSGGGSVVGGYDNAQYDQYDNYHQGGGSTVVGSNYGEYDDGYGGKQQQHGGYNQGYNQGYPPHDQGYPPHDQGYPPHHDQGGYGHGHDYGYDHPVPTGAPYHGGR